MKRACHSGRLKGTITTWCWDPGADQGWYWVLTVDGQRLNGGVARDEYEAQAEGRWAFGRYDARRRVTDMNGYTPPGEEGL